jgi:hypothetical protein
MAALQAAVEALARRLPGRLGCFVCSGRGEEWAAHRADEEFATASVIKVPIAIATAAEVEAGRLSWDHVPPPRHLGDVGDSGLIQYLSPLSYTVRDLLFLMLAVSDNRATNALVDLIGVGQLNAFLRAAAGRALVSRAGWGTSLHALADWRTSRRRVNGRHVQAPLSAADPSGDDGARVIIAHSKLRCIGTGCRRGYPDRCGSPTRRGTCPGSRMTPGSFTLRTRQRWPSCLRTI